MTCWMRQYLLSAFADEYASDFDTQLSMLSDNNIQYIEPRFINGKIKKEIKKESTKTNKRFK